MLISIDQARKTVLDAVSTLDAERVPVLAALDRVLAADLRAAGDTPPFPCSAMDGYAIEAGPPNRTLTVTGESRAGAPATAPLEPGQAIRISTGAAIPAGATAVIRQEDVERAGDQIATQATTTEGENIRFAGEDLRAGATVLTAGTTLGAPELGAAVAAGAGEVEVTRRPVVQVFSTGDELREPGEPLGPGEIHNSNAPMLAALASRFGAVSRPPRILKDDRQATEYALGEALEDADVVIISGGVSVGPHDHVKPALQTLGVQELFWGVALQPGKPTWFGRRGQTLVFGLPGNPVSAFVTFSLFAGPALAALQGATDRTARPGRAVLATAVKRNPNREQAIRVRLEQRDGSIVAIPNGPQGSHIISSLVRADALALIPAGDGELAEGTAVALEPLPR